MNILSTDWMDVSVALRTGMVHWPDNPPLRIERTQEMERGDSANVSMLSIGSHTGTHMDAPLHFVRAGLGKRLMAYVRSHPDLQGFRRLHLATRDAHGLYAQFGFTGLTKVENWMEIRDPDVYLR